MVTKALGRGVTPRSGRNRNRSVGAGKAQGTPRVRHPSDQPSPPATPFGAEPTQAPARRRRSGSTHRGRDPGGQREGSAARGRTGRGPKLRVGRVPPERRGCRSACRACLVHGWRGSPACGRRYGSGSGPTPKKACVRGTCRGTVRSGRRSVAGVRAHGSAFEGVVERATQGDAVGLRASGTTARRHVQPQASVGTCWAGPPPAAARARLPGPPRRWLPCAGGSPVRVEPGGCHRRGPFPWPARATSMR
jgi:hypothetical protein